jgi:hypothetical protein
LHFGRRFHSGDLGPILLLFSHYNFFARPQIRDSFDRFIGQMADKGPQREIPRIFALPACCFEPLLRSK